MTANQRRPGFRLPWSSERTARAERWRPAMSEEPMTPDDQRRRVCRRRRGRGGRLEAPAASTPEPAAEMEAPAVPRPPRARRPAAEAASTAPAELRPTPQTVAAAGAAARPATSSCATWSPRCAALPTRPATPAWPSCTSKRRRAGPPPRDGRRAPSHRAPRARRNGRCRASGSGRAAEAERIQREAEQRVVARRAAARAAARRRHQPHRGGDEGRPRSRRRVRARAGRLPLAADRDQRPRRLCGRGKADAEGAQPRQPARPRLPTPVPPARARSGEGSP